MRKILLFLILFALVCSACGREPFEHAAATLPLGPGPVVESAETAEESPTTENPSAPSGYLPSEGEASSEAPTTEAPTTENPSAPSGHLPSEGEGGSEAPTTEAPATENPSAPSGHLPSEGEASSEAPMTEAPTTEAPTTPAPTTSRAPSDDARLAALSLSGRALSPAFDPDTYRYDLYVEHGTDSLIPSYRPADENAEAFYWPYLHSIPVGETEFTVRVTAENGYTTRDYTVLIHRAPAPTEPPTTAPPETAAPTQVPTQAPTQVPTQASTPASGGNGIVICLDPGHQAAGNNELEPNSPLNGDMKVKVMSGTSGVTTGIRESVVNLRIALQLRDELEARGYTVVMTRTVEETDISNKERAELANNVGAAALLRLHCDGSVNPSYNGISVLCSGPDNSYNGHLYESSRRLCETLLDKMCAATGAVRRGVFLRTDMTGLNWSLVPGCLIEMGFLTNAEEEAKLLSADYQQLLVQAMADAVDAWLGR